MLTVIIFLIPLFSYNILAIYEEFPETPSYLIPETKLLPERGDSRITVLKFQDSIPIACFCNRLTCNVNVKSIQSPVLGLIQRDGKMVTSLEIKVNQSELMYIILIDSKSIVADGSYFQRTSYWQLIDGQHQVLPEVPFDFEISRQVSISILKQNNAKFNFDSETKNIALTAIEISTGLSISSIRESEDTNIYRYSPSQVNRAVGVYQLIHELVIYPGTSLMNYIGNQSTGAQCTSYIFLKERCGFLLLLPSFLQRTPFFRQVAVDLEARKSVGDSSDQNFNLTDSSQTITEQDQSSNKTGLSTRIIVIIILVLIVTIFLGGLVLILWRCKPCQHTLLGHMPIPADDYNDQELTVISHRKTESVLPII